MNKRRRQGKKGKAERIILERLTLVNRKLGTKRTNGNALLIFHQALNQLRPVLTLVSRRIGRRFYQIPVPLPTFKQYKLALK